MPCQSYNWRKLRYQKCRPAQSLKKMLLWFLIESFKIHKKNLKINDWYKNSNLFADPFEMAKFTTSRKGNLKLVDTAGYEYTKQHASGIKIYWICSKYKSLKCPARATTEGNFVIKSVRQHIHWNKCSDSSLKSLNSRKIQICLQILLKWQSSQQVSGATLS